MKRAVLLAALMLAACATVLPRIEAPKVAVTQVEIDRLTAADARFTITVKLTNPNDRDVAVDAITADLSIENISVGRAVLTAPVMLPARGETSAAMASRADFASALRATAEISRRLAAQPDAGSHVHFTVSGVATMNGGVTVPFSRTGEFSIKMAGEK